MRMFENRVLRRIFGSRRNGRQENRENYIMRSLMIFYSSLNIFRVMETKRMRWVGHVARMGRGEACTGFCWGNMKERAHLGDPGVDRRIIVRWIFRMWDVGVWTGSSRLRIETGELYFENAVMSFRVQ
jgi:hypothetical protein